MKIKGKEYKTIWFEENIVKIIDKNKIPHRFIIKEMKTDKDAEKAIKLKEGRGEPKQGANDAYGIG